MKRHTTWVLATVFAATGCGGGLTSDEVQSQIDAAIEDAQVEPSTTSSTAGTTTTASSTTTVPESTTSTEASPEFPPERENLEHGGETWAVILAASTGFSDPALNTATLSAEGAGYRAGATDCDVGVIEALGLPEDDHYYTVSVYFDTEAEATQARDAFYARGVGATVAVVRTYCLD